MLIGEELGKGGMGGDKREGRRRRRGFETLEKKNRVIYSEGQTLLMNFMCSFGYLVRYSTFKICLLTI